MKVENLIRGQKLFRTLLLVVLLILSVGVFVNSLAYAAVTGKPMYWPSVIVAAVLAFIALKLRPLDDPYRTAMRSENDKC